MTKIITNPTVHLFDSTGDAYDQTQYRDDISDGDVLVVESERVVGFLCAAWPTAITSDHGSFHTLAEGADITRLGKRDAKHEGTLYALPADPGTDYSASVREAESVLALWRESDEYDAQLSDDERAYFAAHSDERTLADQFPVCSRVAIMHSFKRRKRVGTGEVLGYVLGWYDTGSPESGPGPVERCELVRVRCDDGSVRNAYPGDLDDVDVDV